MRVCRKETHAGDTQAKGNSPAGVLAPVTGLRQEQRAPCIRAGDSGLSGPMYLFASSAARSELALVAGDTIIILLVWDEGA